MTKILRKDGRVDVRPFALPVCVCYVLFWDNPPWWATVIALVASAILAVRIGVWVTNYTYVRLACRRGFRERLYERWDDSRH